MLAVAGELPADDSGWAYEMKWDGLRAIAYVGQAVRLQSRTGRDISHAYPELAGLADALGGQRVVLDGEIVAFGADGWPSFEALQQRMNISSAGQARALAAQVHVTYLAFDLLFLAGRPLLDLPYRERRGLLDGLGHSGGPGTGRSPPGSGRGGPSPGRPARCWQIPPAFTDESGARVQAVSRQHGLEGVMAKRLDSRYEPGRRSPSWRKIKNVRRQEAVIGGWSPGSGGRAGRIGSLLIGTYAPGGLRYAGHVGTGFSQQALAILAARLAPLGISASPFAGPVPAEHARGAVWVRPELVIDVAFAGWTSAGRMRAASYKGLRDDKDPAGVIREP